MSPFASPQTSERPDGWVALLAAGFPTAVIVHTALGLYVHNAHELLDGPKTLALITAAALPLWGLLFAALRWGGWPGKLVWALPSAYAVFYLVRELAFPLPLVPLAEGTSFVPRTSLAYRTAELITFAGALTLLLRVGLRRTSAVLSAFTAVFAFSSAASAAWHVRDLFPSLPRETTSVSSASSTTSPSTARPDVYHFLFDEYMTVENRFARRLYGPEPFEDFICYPKNISNYNWTKLSLPSLWSSTLYTPDQRVEDWQISARSGPGLLKTFKENGYRVHLWGFRRSWCESPFADSVRDLRDVAEDCEKKTSGVGSAVASDEFLDLVKLRCLPSLLGKWRLAADNTPGRLPHKGSAHPFYSMLMFREMVADIKNSPDGGNYRFMHLILPHPPYVLDGEGHGQYVGAKQGKRFGQVRVIDRLMGEFVAELKRLGRYDRSLIVVHADTGAYVDPHLDRQALTPDGEMKQVPEWGGYPSVDEGDSWPVPVVVARTQAAFLIKPPDHHGQREVDAPTQLLDLAPTILSAVGLPTPESFQGVNLLAGSPGPDRARKAYVYSIRSSRPGVPLQEYSVHHGRYNKGPIVVTNGIIDYESAGEPR